MYKKYALRTVGLAKEVANTALNTANEAVKTAESAMKQIPGYTSRAETAASKAEESKTAAANSASAAADSKAAAGKSATAAANSASAAAESKTAAANSVKAAEAAKAKAEDVVKGIADTKAEAIAQIEAAGVEATQNIKGYTKEETNALLRAAGIHTQVGAPIYGIKRVWNTESVSDTWKRTDASVGMEANPTIGAKVGKDDFSYVMPWAGIVSKCCDLDTGETVAYIGEPGYDPTKYMVLTEYPGFYLKRWRDDTYEYVQISAGAFDGAVYIEPWEWGRYPSSLMGNKHVSMSGKHPDCRTNRATVRARSKAAGEGYYSMDSTSYWAYSMLVLVKYASLNTQEKVCKGYYYLRYTDQDKALVAEQSTNRIVIALATAANEYLVGNAVEIGTSLGGAQVAKQRLITRVTPVDFVIKHIFKIKYYFRYMDDMLLFSSNKKKLRQYVACIRDALSRIGLHIKSKLQVHATNDKGKLGNRPIDFIGYRFYRDCTTLRSSICLRITRRIRKVRKKQILNGHDARSIISYYGWIKNTDSYGLKVKYFKDTVKSAKEKISNGSGKNQRRRRDRRGSTDRCGYSRETGGACACTA